MAEVDGPAAALAIVDALAADGSLDDYHLLHSARAEFSRRLGRLADAEKSYARALELASNDSERRFLERAPARRGTSTPVSVGRLPDGSSAPRAQPARRAESLQSNPP